MYPTVRTIRKLVENKNRVYLYHFAYSGGYKLTIEVFTKLGYEGKLAVTLLSSVLTIVLLERERGGNIHMYF